MTPALFSVSYAGFWGQQVDTIPVAPPADPVRARTTRPVIWKSDRSVANYGYRGSTGIFATPDDLFRFAAAFRAGRLVSADNVTSMITSKKADIGPEATSYGYGWAVQLRGGKTAEFWHGGNEDWLGHNAMLKVVGERTYVILCNSGDVDGEGWSHRIEAGLRSTSR